MLLHTETSVGDGGRMTCSADWYITTISLIGAFTCSMRHSFLQNVDRKWWATRMGDVTFPVIVRSFPYMMSRVTLVFTMDPRPSHGPFPWPGQLNSTHTIFSLALWLWGLSDQKLRFSFDLKWVALSFPCWHTQNFCLRVTRESLTSSVRPSVLINATSMKTARAASPKHQYAIHPTRPRCVCSKKQSLSGRGFCWLSSGPTCTLRRFCTRVPSRRWSLRSQLSTSARISWASPASTSLRALLGCRCSSISSIWVWSSSLSFCLQRGLIRLRSACLYDLYPAIQHEHLICVERGSSLIMRERFVDASAASFSAACNFYDATTQVGPWCLWISRPSSRKQSPKVGRLLDLRTGPTCFAPQPHLRLT